MRLLLVTRPFRFSGRISTVCPKRKGRQRTRKKLAVMLLIIAHVARKATPMTVMALTRTAQTPPRLTPHVLIMTRAVTAQRTAVTMRLMIRLFRRFDAGGP